MCVLSSAIVDRPSYICTSSSVTMNTEKKNSRTKEEATETNALHIYFFIRFSCWNHMDDVRKHISLVMKHHTDDAAERTKYICSKRKIMTKNRRKKKAAAEEAFTYDPMQKHIMLSQLHRNCSPAMNVRAHNEKFAQVINIYYEWFDRKNIHARYIFSCAYNRLFQCRYFLLVECRVCSFVAFLPIQPGDTPHLTI